jgi:hypothetical protein
MNLFKNFTSLEGYGLYRLRKKASREEKIPKSIPQGLKPNHLWVLMYGLKPVPFNPYSF